MGCGSSVDVMSRMKEQEKKIDDLIEINQNLQKRLNELNTNQNNEGKHSSDTNDLTNFKSTLDLRFTKLEKTVGKMHNDFKVKLFEGIGENLGNGQENRNRRDSLTLNFEQENIGKPASQVKKEADPHWNELLHDSSVVPQRISKENLQTQEDEVASKVPKTKAGIKGAIDHNDIRMEFGKPDGNGRLDDNGYQLNVPRETGKKPIIEFFSLEDHAIEGK